MGLNVYPASAGFIRRQQTFTSSGTFTPPSSYGASKPLVVDFIAVGGGGSGGGNDGSGTSGGGGGGRVVKGTLSLVGSVPIVIGAGGSRQTGNTWGNPGGYTLIGVGTEGNLIENPFFFDGCQFSSSNWNFSTLLGSTNSWRQPQTNTYWTDPISDGANPLGVYRYPSYVQFYNGATVSKSRATSSNFYTVSASTTYYWGFYTNSNSSNNLMEMYVDWYTSGQSLISSTTVLSTTSTSQIKTSTSGTSPANAAYAKIRFEVTHNSTNLWVNLFGIYLSKNLNYCPYEDINDSVYWTGTKWTSTLNYLANGNILAADLPTNPASNRGIIAGGGGAGGWSTGSSQSPYYHRYNYNAPGAGVGGFAGNTYGNSTGQVYLGGSGGGAGGPALNNSEQWRESYTSGQVMHSYGAYGSYDFNMRFPSYSPWQNFSYYNHRMVGNEGSFPVQFNQNNDASTWACKIDVLGGPPSPEGFSAGGPGSGWHDYTAGGIRVYRYSHTKASRFGNGGSGYQALGQSYGRIDHHQHGSWWNWGDPGMVQFTWFEEA